MQDCGELVDFCNELLCGAVLSDEESADAEGLRAQATSETSEEIIKMSAMITN